MTEPLVFTGERFIPGAAVGEIVYEHVHRYAFAWAFARGRRVLDAACGEGYGSALLAEAAASVMGVDIDPASVAHAKAVYHDRARLSFCEGSVTRLPLPDASVDLVVSFETIEHLPSDDQPRMLAEFARVLAPDGLLLISSPNRPEYSEARNYSNPFHLHELDRAEFASLLSPNFPAQRWFRQRLWLGSIVWAEEAGEGFEAWNGDSSRLEPAKPPEATYFMALAARNPRGLPGTVSLSLFCDVAETEMKRAEAHAREAIRLDVLAGERLAALDRQVPIIQELERVAAEHGSAFAACKRELADCAAQRDGYAAECRRLELAVGAQERLVTYRQSFRWWLRLPLFRVKSAWDRLRNT